MKIDHCIVGLGNPGSKYQATRHNIGFLAIDKLAGFFDIKDFTLENNYLYGLTVYKDKTIALIKPLTYMNLSGEAVKAFYGSHDVKQENTLIIYDDINLDFGVLRIRPNGSDGGQNGIKSVIYELETDEIHRLRVGVGNNDEMNELREKGRFNLADYVLSEFTGDEYRQMNELLSAVKDSVVSIIDDGIGKAMNVHNKNVLALPEIPKKTTDKKNSASAEDIPAADISTTDISGENNNN